MGTTCSKLQDRQEGESVVTNQNVGTSQQQTHSSEATPVEEVLKQHSSEATTSHASTDLLLEEASREHRSRENEDLSAASSERQSNPFTLASKERRRLRSLPSTRRSPPPSAATAEVFSADEQQVTALRERCADHSNATTLRSLRPSPPPLPHRAASLSKFTSVYERSQRAALNMTAASRGHIGDHQQHHANDGAEESSLDCTQDLSFQLLHRPEPPPQAPGVTEVGTHTYAPPSPTYGDLMMVGSKRRRSVFTTSYGMSDRASTSWSFTTEPTRRGASSHHHHHRSRFEEHLSSVTFANMAVMIVAHPPLDGDDVSGDLFVSWESDGVERSFSVREEEGAPRGDSIDFLVEADGRGCHLPEDTPETLHACETLPPPPPQPTSDGNLHHHGTTSRHSLSIVCSHDSPRIGYSPPPPHCQVLRDDTISGNNIDNSYSQHPGNEPTQLLQCSYRAHDLELVRNGDAFLVPT